ncbi:MAG: hypothetical protein COV48_08375 [Elusimicrobia bacterium CG11_big_fil_rev_8_21_14_0_20_64_6]|nr:MAG: hypothetical protein COV48_08375 [Elusimicrobia bacterium CG11_big_fil_rev_8_21_14_0_20_64_6]
MRALFIPAIAALAACGYVSFGRTVSDDELRLRSSVRGYYDEVGRTFATANTDALTLLFDAAITKPMNREEIAAWAKSFFARHGAATFKVRIVEYERLGFDYAVVLLDYRVTTKDGKGDFGGLERDYLTKRGRRWIITAWEKVEEPKPAP